MPYCLKTISVKGDVFQLAKALPDLIIKMGLNNG